MKSISGSPGVNYFMNKFLVLRDFMHIHITESGYIKKGYAAVRSFKYSSSWLNDTNRLW